MYKKAMVLLLPLLLLTSCGVKEKIRQASETVKKEDSSNLKENRVSQDIIDEETEGLKHPEKLSVNVDEYISLQKKLEKLEIKKELIKNTDIDNYEEYQLTYGEGMVVERITTIENEKLPIAYDIEVKNKNKKFNQDITNSDFAFATMSNMLMDAKITDKPLELITKIDKKKENFSIELGNGVTLLYSEQKDIDGFLLNLNF
ncbi:hypothetical protein [Vagococcus hydrophili]|uniref:Lipoprotein n=1 Tax=Vagococcus hydrophili TaxID=2714947 RepID=A0A6G8ATE8_9ENTE|nr:hypothetical protein [Vagococcus hydrophili]QIL48267.1 hypothetical protein G7082_07060 [Vagococcus hydrophili]